jgi:hypothetical protein
MVMKNTQQVGVFSAYVEGGGSPTWIQLNFAIGKNRVTIDDCEYDNQVISGFQLEDIRDLRYLCDRIIAQHGSKPCS